MKKLSGVLAVALFLSLASAAEARSPIAPRTDMLGAVPYVGAGFRMETLEFEPVHATHIRLRVPSHCALQINPITVLGENGRAQGRLVTSLNDGQYSHWVYSLNGGLGQEIDTVELGLNSSFYYTPRHQCGVRVWATVGSPTQR